MERRCYAQATARAFHRAPFDVITTHAVRNCARLKSARICSKVTGSPWTTSMKYRNRSRQPNHRRSQDAPLRPLRLSEFSQAIVDMRLRALVGLERQKIEDEYAEMIKLIAELEDILNSPRRVLQIVKAETLEIKKKFGDERRTISNRPKTNLDEQLIPNVDISLPTPSAATSSALRSTRSHAESRRCA